MKAARRGADETKPTMTEFQDAITGEELDDMTEAAEESEAEKEAARRAEDREATKYGSMLNDN